jgi:hypothetical protein
MPPAAASTIYNNDHTMGFDLIIPSTTATATTMIDSIVILDDNHDTQQQLQLFESLSLKEHNHDDDDDDETATAATTTTAMEDSCCSLSTSSTSTSASMMSSSSSNHNKDNNTKQQRRLHRVSFAKSTKDINQVHETIHVSDYTREERRKTWYTIHDLKQFKKERKLLAKYYDKHHKHSSDAIDVRGIENATLQGSRIRRVHIIDGIASVLQEQDLQYQDCKYNVDALAYIYSCVSSESRYLAYQRGQQDYQVVKEMWTEKEDMVTIPL